MRVLTMLIFSIGGLMVLFTNEPTEADKHDLHVMEGTWVLTHGETDGHEIPEEVRKTARLVITGDHHVVHVGDMTAEGTHVVNAGAHPKTIDGHDVAGTHKGKTLPGIYELTKDEFKVCFGTHDKRPTDFTAKAGSGNFVHVWHRAKDAGHAAE